MSLLDENFTINNAKEVDEQHDRPPRSQVPFSLMAKGPATLRRASTGAREAYVVTNGGALDLIVKETS